MTNSFSSSLRIACFLCLSFAGQAVATPPFTAFHRLSPWCCCHDHSVEPMVGPTTVLVFSDACQAYRVAPPQKPPPAPVPTVQDLIDGRRDRFATQRFSQVQTFLNPGGVTLCDSIALIHPARGCRWRRSGWPSSGLLPSGTTSGG